MEKYIILIHRSYDDRYFVQCDSYERAKAIAKEYRKQGDRIEIQIYKAEFIEHLD